MKAWLVAAWLALISHAQAETFSFALIGDVPYSDNERRELPRLLEAIADSQVDFVAHVGDFKHGSGRCDDDIFVDRQQLFDHSRVPFVFIPGDNEWTDCERLSNGSYAQQERLDKLRSLFWQDNQSLGQKKLALTRQPGPYVEHSRFQLGPVLFVTLNLPGGNNNYGLGDRPSADFQARNPAVLDWLKKGFAHKGYREFLETLRDETGQFSGQVVAVHGDTHISRIDQPLRDAMGRPLHNFVRVETFGYPLMGWTRAIIDTDSTSLFRFETHPWPDK